MHEKVEIDICHLTKFWLKAFEPEIQLPSHFSVESMSGVGLSIGILLVSTRSGFDWLLPDCTTASIKHLLHHGLYSAMHQQ